MPVTWKFEHFGLLELDCLSRGSKDFFGELLVIDDASEHDSSHHS